MTNLYKYCETLDLLNTEEAKTESTDIYFTRLLKQLEKHLSKTWSEVADDSIFKNTLSDDDISGSWKFSCFLYHILLVIDQNLETGQFDRRLLLNYNKTLSAVSVYGLTPYLHKDLLGHPCFQTDFKEELKESSSSNQRLSVSVEIFSKLVQNKLLEQNLQIDQILLQLLAGIFTLICENQANEQQKCQSFLDQLYKMNGEKFIKLLLILKSIKDQPLKMKQLIHKDLLYRLKMPGGFENLCTNVLQAQNEANSQPAWKRVEILANIVGHKGHTMSFYKCIIDEIYNFLLSSSKSIYITACIGCLSKIYNLPYEIVQQQIESKFFQLFNEFSEPKERLTGSIIVDDQELRHLFQTIFIGFCSSGPASLPSSMLIKYLPQLMHFYSQLGDVNSEIPKQIALVIVQCLANRESKELKSIVKSLIFEEYPMEMKQLDPRVQIKQNTNENKQISIQIVSENDVHYYDSAQILLDILKQSKHNILVYNIFTNLLEFLIDFIDVRHESASDLIDDFTDLSTLMQKSFKKPIAIVYTLSELLNFKSFHCQFAENPDGLLNLFQMILMRKIEQFEKKQSKPLTENKEIMILIVTIIREFVAELKDRKDLGNFTKILKDYQTVCIEEEIKQQISITLDVIEGRKSSKINIDTSQYAMAKHLCEGSEPYLIVYGLTQLKKLIQIDHDEETLANKHSILALALHCLKGEDSYLFLNCIKVIVALVDCLDIGVIDALIAEYQNDNNEMDYRLKIGEAIVKVTEELGPLSYKYKSLLINCFIRGSSNKENEFRTSSLSNLGVICRMLSYQVQSFFEELMLLVASIIQTDQYLPARQAAVMVLSQILGGLNNLMDFQEIILPIYRMLKHIKTDQDQTIRMHVSIGLDHLNAKVKELFEVKQNMTKEIKVFGIRDSDDNISCEIRYK